MFFLFAIYIAFCGLYYLSHCICFGYDFFMTYRGYLLGDTGYTRIDINQFQQGDTIIV